MEGRRCPQRSEPAVLTKFVPPPGPHHSKGVLHGLPASPIFRFESSGHAPALRCARGLPLRSNGDAGATCPRTRNARPPLEGLRAAHEARSDTSWAPGWVAPDVPPEVDSGGPRCSTARPRKIGWPSPVRRAAERAAARLLTRSAGSGRKRAPRRGVGHGGRARSSEVRSGKGVPGRSLKTG